MAGGALRRGIVVATTVVAGVGLPAGAAVATDGHGDRGGCCHHCGGHRQEHGRPWHWPDRTAGEQAQPLRSPTSRPATQPARPAPAPVPRRVERTVAVPVAPTPSAPPSQPAVSGGGETLAVGAALTSPARSWPALMLPAVAGAAILGLIAAGFATRRGLSKVD
jgi:hypothetical protein